MTVCWSRWRWYWMLLTGLLHRLWEWCWSRVGRCLRLRGYQGRLLYPGHGGSWCMHWHWLHWWWRWQFPGDCGGRWFAWWGSWLGCFEVRVGDARDFSSMTWILVDQLPCFLCLLLCRGCACTVHLSPDVDCCWDRVCLRLGLLLGFLRLLS